MSDEVQVNAGYAVEEVVALMSTLREMMNLEDGELYALHKGLLRRVARQDEDSGLRRIKLMEEAYEAAQIAARRLRKYGRGYRPDPALVVSAFVMHACAEMTPEDADAVFAESAKPAPMWLRVNRRRGSRDDYAQRLREAGIEAIVVDGLVDALRLEHALPVAELPGFDAGDVSVQDGSAQAVADALSPPAGSRVLDACAAPGGKSAHLAERDPTLRIVALDVDARRVRRMQDTFARLGLEIESRAADATDPAAWREGTAFDAILLDAPCSATGIVRRQPDVLLHRRESDLAALTGLQSRLLQASWPALAPGGVLLYATCSILAAENADQIRAFLARHPDARLEPLDARFGRDTGFGAQRLPGEDGMDGFFYARLRKR